MSEDFKKELRRRTKGRKEIEVERDRKRDRETKGERESSEVKRSDSKRYAA